MRSFPFWLSDIWNPMFQFCFSCFTLFQFFPDQTPNNTSHIPREWGVLFQFPPGLFQFCFSCFTLFQFFSNQKPDIAGDMQRKRGVLFQFVSVSFPKLWQKIKLVSVVSVSSWPDTKRRQLHSTKTVCFVSVVSVCFSFSQDTSDTSCLALSSAHSRNRMYFVSLCVLCIRAVVCFFSRIYVCCCSCSDASSGGFVIISIIRLISSWRSGCLMVKWFCYSVLGDV